METIHRTTANCVRSIVVTSLGAEPGHYVSRKQTRPTVPKVTIPAVIVTGGGGELLLSLRGRGEPSLSLGGVAGSAFSIL